MVRQEKIISPQRGAGASGDCFLPDCGMRGAFDRAAEEEGLRPFLELPDEHHLVEYLAGGRIR
jgi:hypothetical protein